MAKDYKCTPHRTEVGCLGYIEGLTLHSLENDNEALIHYFGGIPYALPPIGPYRFRKPRSLPDYYRYGTKANPGSFTGSTAVCPQPAKDKDEEPDKSLWSEDCLQLNIYIPANETLKPAEGWPILFYIHGGFLQWGEANVPPAEMTPLLSETAFKAIVVTSAYRVNLFGFLAGRELNAENGGHYAGNMGFWDQRLALEWTAKNIACFGGDPKKITVAGYSAGAHSAFHQLAHELYFIEDDQAIIRRVIMWSNGPGVQPRVVSSQQVQFDELLEAVGIPLSIPSAEKLEKLRALPAKELVDVQSKLTRSEFRATSDGSFVHRELLKNINSGDFARRMKARKIVLMNGECRDEHNSYRQWRTPSQSYEAVLARLSADYPTSIVERLLEFHCGAAHELPAGMNWQELFGKLYADMQVHCLERGFHNALVNGGMDPGKDLLRYRFDWRASKVDMPEEWGVTHASDIPIWFYGSGTLGGLSEADKKTIEPFNNAFADFVSCQAVPQWRTSSVKEMLRLGADGITDIWIDDQWDQGLNIWALVNR